MIGLMAVASGVGGFLMSKAMQTVQMGTGFFGSIVSVTGDAHQAQIAQDIFRADMKHELSLLVREDMRDVYSLMCETVATQVTMGSICLGVCFGIFIEGYASGAQAWVLELWAMFVAWGTLFTLLSLLLAMLFQMSIKNAVFERLLMKHRIFTPNDTVISSLGGRSLAEQVSRLHARSVNYLAALDLAMLLGKAEKEKEDEEGDEVPDEGTADVATGHPIGVSSGGVAGGGGGDQVADAGAQGLEGAAASTALPEKAVPAAGRFGDRGAGAPPNGKTPSRFGSGAFFAAAQALGARAFAEQQQAEAGRKAAQQAAGGLDDEAAAEMPPSVSAEMDPPDCQKCLGTCPLKGKRIVRAHRNVQAWFNEATHRVMEKHKIAELPGFLSGGALVRLPWILDFSKRSVQEEHGELRLKVYDEATLYVAGRLREKEISVAAAAAAAQSGTGMTPGPLGSSGDAKLDGQSPTATTKAASTSNVVDAKSSWIQYLDISPLTVGWDQDELPIAETGAHAECKWFQRVEGFSVFIDSHRKHIPLYKLVLEAPEDGEHVDVTIKWRFKTEVQGLTVVLREGLVLSSEDEYPKKAFLQEVEVLFPLIDFAERCIKCGMSCLLFAVLWMHFSRIFPVRPLPECAGEVTALSAAASVALVGIWTRVPLNRNGRLFQLEEEERRERERKERDSHREQAAALPSEASGCDVAALTPANTSTTRGGEDDGLEEPPYSSSSSPSEEGTRFSRARAKLEGMLTAAMPMALVSNKLWRKKQRTWFTLATCFFTVSLLFFASFIWCITSALASAASSSADLSGDSAGAAPGGSPGGLGGPPPDPWASWPSSWPQLLPPTGASLLGADGGGEDLLWVASSWQMYALGSSLSSSDGGSSSGRSAPVAPPLRLPFGPSLGLVLVGEKLGTVSAGGAASAAGGGATALRVLNRSALNDHVKGAGAGAGEQHFGLVSGLFAEEAPLAAGGAAAFLPGETELGGEAVAFAGAPDASLWAPPSSPAAWSDAFAAAEAAGSGVLVVAVAPKDAAAPSSSSSPSSGSLLLLSASGLGSPSPSLRPIARLRPSLPALPDGRPAPPPHALHVSTAAAAVAASAGGGGVRSSGEDAAQEETWLWAAAGEGPGMALLAVGLSTGEVLEVPSPWPPAPGLRIAALAGNATHLLAIAEVTATARATDAIATEARVARYSDLLQGRMGEL